MHIPTLRCLPSDRHGNLFNIVIMLFLLISRMLSYIFLLLSITIIFRVWQHKPYQRKVLPFGLAMAPGVFTSLNKPTLFLCCCKGFCINIYLDDILLLSHLKDAGKSAQTFLCPLLVCLGLHITFAKSKLNFNQHFYFGGLCWVTVDMSLSLPSVKLI